MGKKEDFLASTVYNILGEDKVSYSKLTLSELKEAGLVNEIQRVYKKIGGVCESFPMNYRWDIQCRNFVLELDEELHFNRYRLMTLNSSIYDNYQFFSIENYKDYCNKYENRCLKAGSWGQKWKSKSSDKQFLQSGLEGDLNGNGSSRWRQRAFYDYLKDVNSLVRNIKTIRVSIYDKFHNEPLKDILAMQDKIKLKMYLSELFDKYEI